MSENLLITPLDELAALPGEEPKTYLLERSVTPGMEGILSLHKPPGQGKKRWYVLFSGDRYAKVRKNEGPSGVHYHNGNRITFDLAVEFHQDSPEPSFFAENVREWKRKRRQ